MGASRAIAYDPIRAVFSCILCNAPLLFLFQLLALFQFVIRL
jgi:hypothetical protein